MHKRMLDKNNMPAPDEMAAYCGECASLFCELNDWLTPELEAVNKTVFPYGDSYGWGISH